MYAPQLARAGARIFQTAALALTAALAACSGGAPTTLNPVTGTAAVQSYTGPAPQTADVQAFMNNLWVNIKDTNRCGGCHQQGGQGTPSFARNDDINLAYQAASQVVNLQQPSQSLMVQKVSGGHNCWLASPQACGADLTVWIQNWAGTTATGASTIKLVAPPEITVGASKTFPASPALYQQYIYTPITSVYCSRCHSDTAASAQQPFFASADIDIAYAAAQPKIDLNTPTNSRFYQRLSQDHHNCWSDCNTDAQLMLTAIQNMAGQIQVTPIDPTLVVSKALTLYDGTVASGQNRYTDAQIALYEFQTGTGNIAYDTSGVAPELDLTMNSNATFVQGWGINIGAGGKAQGTTTASSKIYDMITSTGEFSIEAWVNPANQAQMAADIVSYSGGPTVRNFTLQQNAFQYEADVRSSVTSVNGVPALATNANNQLAQAALQHVVLTYDPVNGRKLYVNGQFTGDVDASGGGTLANWDNTFALVLGSEVSGSNQWTGVINMVAIHNRALTPSQIMQNFNAGVGEKYFLLFDVSSLTNVPQSYVMLTASLNDNYSYLFANPTFISLDPTQKPSGINIQGIRIGVNGAEAPVGQTYIPLNATVTASAYNANTGQVLSNVGAVIPLENGPAADQFFLTFAQIGSHSHTYVNPTVTAAPPIPGTPGADLGVRTFERINQTMAKATGVTPLNASVAQTYATVQQSLPSIPDFDAYTASEQTAIAQMAIAYCAAMSSDPTLGPQFFGAGYDPTQPGSWLTNAANQSQVINAIYTNVVGTNAGVQLASQPSLPSVQTELTALINTLAAGSAGGQSGGTGLIAGAACSSVLASASMLVQ